MSGASSPISVVVPAYNAERTIEQTLQSVLEQQSCPDFEVIVVDDGSCDRTAKLVAAMRDPRLTLVRQPNSGVATARNTGIVRARGEWIALLDADDIWLRNKLHAQFELLQSQPSACAVQCGAHLVDDHLRILETRRCRSDQSSLLHFLRFENLPAVSSTWVVRRSTLISIGLFDPGLDAIEDWDLSLRLARFGTTCCVEEPLVLYRQHAHNRSSDLDSHVRAGLTILARFFADETLPNEIAAARASVYARFYLMLCGGALRAQRWRDCARWGIHALLLDPTAADRVVALPARTLRRRLHDRRGA
jgi:glycosyltransferase involved in cell wall biosynthesis